MGRDLGALAEKELERWAAQVGASATRPDADKMGWDYLVELPLEPQEGKPFDLGLPPLKALVQVKGTDKESGSIPVKLSNWFNLVKAPMPAFFLVIEYSESIAATRVYLVHVGKREIRDVLERLRNMPEGMELHKRRRRLSYSKRARPLPELTGTCLFQEMRQVIGKDLGRYVQQKVELLETVGYEEGGQVMRGRVEMPEEYATPEEYMVAFELGLAGAMTLRDVTWHDGRFGIEQEHPLWASSEVLVEVQPGQHLKGEVRFGGGRAFYRMDVDVVRPSTILPSHPEFKMRFRSSLVDVIVAPVLGGVSCSLADIMPEDSYVLGDFVDMGKYVEILSEACEAGGRLAVELRVPSISSECLFRSESDTPISEDPLVPSTPLGRLAQASVWASEVARRFGFAIDKTVLAKKLVEHRGYLFVLALMASGQAPPIRLAFSVQDDQDWVGREVSLLKVISLDWGGHSWVFGLDVFGRAQKASSARSRGHLIAGTAPSEDLPFEVVAEDAYQIRIAEEVDPATWRVETTIDRLVEATERARGREAEIITFSKQPRSTVVRVLEK